MQRLQHIPENHDSWLIDKNSWETMGCKDKGIRKSEFVAKTQFL